MNISKMLEKEAKVIKNNNDVGKRIDCSDILISTRFSDNHIHHILPSQQITDTIIFDLLSYMDLKENTINDIMVKILSIYIENNNKEDNSFDQMIDLIVKIKDKLIESKEINNKRKLIKLTTREEDKNQNGDV